MNYVDFINNLDIKLNDYFLEQKDYIFCKEGCSFCCEKGDYPVSQLELEYIMQGYIGLDNTIKKVVQGNIQKMERGKACPFLVDKKCSIYPHRPIICRVHGLAYICKENTVKIPYCVNDGKNFASIYKDGEIDINPVKECLDTPSLLKNLDYGEIRNLYDWLINKD